MKIEFNSGTVGVAAIALSLLLFEAAHSQPSQPSRPTLPPNLVELKDVVYATANGKPLHMDIVRNNLVTTPAPVVVCIHGGGWAAGAKEDMHQYSYGLAKLGFTTASIEYRLAPQAKFPCQIDDAQAAVLFLRSKAQELHIDSTRIAALGGSAGAHLALLLAERSADGNTLQASSAHPSALRAAVSISGPTDLNAPDLSAQARAIVLGFIGTSYQQNPDAYRKASPLFCLTHSCPPLLLIHGDKDELVPYTQATRMLQECNKEGVQAELFTLHNVGHGLAGGSKEELDESIRKLVAFLNKNLRN